MKLIMSILLISATIAARGQSSNIPTLIKTTTEGLKEKQVVSYDYETAMLQIGDWLIPVSKDTHLERKNWNEVAFLLQKGTAITSRLDQNERKANLVLTFKTKKSAKAFTQAFIKASSQT